LFASWHTNAEDFSLALEQDLLPGDLWPARVAVDGYKEVRLPKVPDDGHGVLYIMIIFGSVTKIADRPPNRLL
jgi:hypothetical protein